jgi:tetratricopeptide (TPR) repeat protein
MTERSLPEESIFAQALEIGSTAERAAFLDRACGDDPALRAEVEALLRAHDQPADLLNLPDQPVRTVDYPSGPERPGAVIGPYKLLEQIGEGGFGIVFMADQMEPVRRKVALKVLKPGMDTRQVVARFEAERQALAIMDHPNIARVHDGGATRSGLPYFVMELVKGVPITDFCDRNHLTPRQRLELFIPVCQAVQHAHQKGIIHRDLKPSNILVTVHDTTPVVKVIDFGVAKALGQELTDKTLFTGFGQLIGTPLYMSPEQAGQSGLDIDTRSDIYSLGVLLYELLTGTTPFTRERFKQAGHDEICRIIREEEPPRPSTRLAESKGTLASISAQRQMDPGKLTKLVRGELDWMVMKCLEKDRNRRYETASSLATDVQRYLHDEPVQACPPSVWYRCRKFARRNRGGLTVAAGIALLLAFLAATIGWAVRDREARQAESERQETARLQAVEQRAQAALGAARGLVADNQVAEARQKLAEARVQLADDRHTLSHLVSEVEAAEADLDRFIQFMNLIDRAHELDGAPVLQHTAGSDGAHSNTQTLPISSGWRQRRTRMAPLFLQALALYAVLEREDWSTSVDRGFPGTKQREQVRRNSYEALIWLAEDVLGWREDHTSAHKISEETAARQALVYLDRARTAHQPTRAYYAMRGACRKALGDQEAARADLQRIRDTPPSMAIDHFLLGQAAMLVGKKNLAVKSFEAALHLEPTHQWSLLCMGACLNDYGQAPEDYAASVGLFTGYIFHAPDRAIAYAWRGIAYSHLKRWEDAVADFSRAIELAPKDPGPWINRSGAYLELNQPGRALADCSRAIELNPLSAQAYGNRGVAYFKLGQPEQAIADYDKSIALDERIITVWVQRGWAYQKQGQWVKALADYSRALELDPKDESSWNNRGEVEAQLGQREKAIADFSRAIELGQKGPDVWNHRGNMYSELGQPEKALADYSRAIELDDKCAAAWHNRGRQYESLNQYEEARRDYSRVIELDPKLQEGWVGRANAFRDLGQFEKARADYATAIELGPKNPAPWNNRGRGYLKLGRLDAAIPDFSRAIELDPKCVEAWYNRGVAHAARSEWEQAIADQTRAIQLKPEFVQPYNDLGWLLATCPNPKFRDPKRAVEIARKAVELAPKEAMYWNTLGVAHYRAGQWQAAVDAVTRSQELGQPLKAFDWFFLAMAHRKLGHTDDARSWYHRAVRWSEDNREAMEKSKQSDELRRLRSEAEEVLEFKKK